MTSEPLICHHCWPKKTNHYGPCEHALQIVADREERLRVLTVERDNQYEENISLIVTLADLEERLRQRDGEWVDAIEDTLHFGIIPETLAGAIECMKAWLEEREGRIRVLEAQVEIAAKGINGLVARIERVKGLLNAAALTINNNFRDELLAALDGETKEPVEIHKRGQIPVNAPMCDKCGKMFLECQCREPKKGGVDG